MDSWTSFSSLDTEIELRETNLKSMYYDITLHSYWDLFCGNNAQHSGVAKVKLHGEQNVIKN